MNKQHKGIDALLQMLVDTLYTNSAGTTIPFGRLGSSIIKNFAGGAVQALDVGPYRFITQNPNKSSQWGELARRGHRVAWAIHQPDNRWLYRIVDGEVTKL